jgi:putative membrane protein insertion efficiency factor
MTWADRLLALPQRALMALVRAYRLLLSPTLGSACRFEPSCSAYALQALERHGAAGGTYLTLRRLVRCHPWCDGGHDPVPAALFSHPAHPAAATSEKKPS